VEYKGDTNQLLFANPRNMDSVVRGGEQIKQDLMVTPIFVPYCLMTMRLSYKYNNSQVYTSIVLPNSVIKFASYMRISYEDLGRSWKSCKKYKTKNFRLCRYLAPESLHKWIPLLENITSY
jgi:hypothetical protein